MHHPTDRITHTTAFVTPVVEHWMERVRQESNIPILLLCYEQCLGILVEEIMVNLTVKRKEKCIECAVK